MCCPILRIPTARCTNGTGTPSRWKTPGCSSAPTISSGTRATGDVHATGHVYFRDFDRNEQIWADHLEYNTQDETGKFYDVRGETHPRIVGASRHAHHQQPVPL